MSRLISLFATTLLVGSSAIVPPVTSATAAPAITQEMADAWNAAEINWRDIKSGIREASQNKKTVIMVFHAPWCSACKKYRAVFRDPRIVEESKNFVMILIDVEADKMANGAFSPDGTYVPRTIFLNSDGDVLSQYKSKDPKYPHSLDISSPEELLSVMKKAAADTAPPPAAPGENRT